MMQALLMQGDQRAERLLSCSEHHRKIILEQHRQLHPMPTARNPTL
jgi:hypothetical protein